jgi:hypothetical protein
MRLLSRALLRVSPLFLSSILSPEKMATATNREKEKETGKAA